MPRAYPGQASRVANRGRRELERKPVIVKRICKAISKVKYYQNKAGGKQQGMRTGKIRRGKSDIFWMRYLSRSRKSTRIRT